MSSAPLAALFRGYRAIVFFDTETTGLNPLKNQIIELAAIRVEQSGSTPEGLKVASQMDSFIRLPDGEYIPDQIVELTGITDRMLAEKGVMPSKTARLFAEMLREGPTLAVAHNAQFDLLFVRELLRGYKGERLNFLDSLTVFKDRRSYPHTLESAIEAYDLADKVQNSHRAIDDVLALFEVVKAMDAERADLDSYINLFGYNPKYGRSGAPIAGVKYMPQEYRRGIAKPDQTLPALARWAEQTSLFG